MQQAFYGEVNQSHSCIVSTIVDKELNAFLTRFTDRPGQVPAGIKMEPYYSATSYGNYYIVTLTFPDYSAKRSGMVFTHALIVLAKDIENISTINDLFDHFVSQIPDANRNLEIITLSQSEKNNLEEKFPPFTTKVLEQLFSGQLPVVFCGEQEVFLKLIKLIWRGVPTLMRSKISYTVGFSGNNIDVSKTFLFFQKDLVQQLNNKQFVSDQIDNSPIVNTYSTAQEYILLQKENNEFHSFISELNIVIDNWNIIDLSARAFDSYKDFQNLSNDALKQLIRQVAKISPKSQNGHPIKTKLILELKKRLIDGSEVNLKSLRNIPLEAYHLGEKQIGEGLSQQIDKEFYKEKDFNINLISEIAIDIAKEQLINWWYKEAIKSFNKIGNFTEKTPLKNVWKILTKSKESSEAIYSFLTIGKAIDENSLLKTVPTQIPVELAKHLAARVKNNKWYLLYAHLIQIYLKPKEALLELFSLEKNDTDKTGTSAILLKVSDSDLLNLTLQKKESYFIDKFADRTVSNSLLLNDLKPNNPTWLEIWGRSIEQTKDLGLGINNLPEKIEKVITELSHGINIPTELVKAISKSNFADISDHEKRTSIWKHLSFDVKNQFLQATSDSIIKSSTFDLKSLENDLKNYISSDEYLKTSIAKSESDIDFILTVYERINFMNDQALADYISRYPQPINAAQATRLGNLVHHKNFRNTANVIYDKSNKHNTWRSALVNCYNLLGLFKKIKLIHSGILTGMNITEDQWWQAVEEVILSLYTNPQSSVTIWTRSGGKEADLRMNGTTSDLWNDALRRLRRENKKEISINNLLTEINRQYPENDNFKILFEIRKDFI